MLSVRIQAIDGKRTSTFKNSRPYRLLQGPTFIIRTAQTLRSFLTQFPGTASRPECQTRPSQYTGLPSPCVRSAAMVISCSVSGTMRYHAPPFEQLLPLYPRGPRSGPGYVVPVHPHLTDPIRPTRGHIQISPSRGFIPDAFAVHAVGMPRQPTTGSELSLMLFHNMSPSETTGNPSVAYTQYFTEDAGLQLQITVSAFPSSSHSDSGEGKFSRLDYGSLALRPVAWLALLSEQTGFAPSLRGRLHPGFRSVWSPPRRRI